MGKGQRVDATGRSITNPKYALLNHSTMDCPAFKSLGAVERSTLLMIYHRHNGSNNGMIPLSVREVAQELRIGKSTAAKAFDELQRSGFVRVAMKSSFDWKVESGKFEGRSTRWRLTEEPTGPKEKRIPATRDFASWRSPKDDYDEHHRWREAKKMQKPVRPQVRGVPDVGQSVPADGQSAIKERLGVPDDGQTSQIANISVPQRGQFISTMHSASEGQADGRRGQPLCHPVSSSPSLQSNSSKAKPTSAAHLLQTNFMKRQPHVTQRRN